ncbi:YCF48-related protein [Planctomicrobium sp. SH664]|uniref:YCF48-related protein n=1 Tax=Planctomicrobium sp. SH664 TaxID=3448125 RepID=UPI003F5B65BB
MMPPTRTPTTRLRLLLVLGLVTLLPDQNVWGQGLFEQRTVSSAACSPLQDDATLHDVVLLGESKGWAVGDRGAIWSTETGGATWNFVASIPQIEQFSLRSICFLTDRVGWIAGGTVLPAGGDHQGIVLFTRDAGASWTLCNSLGLPFLKSIQFFDLEQGIAVGERNQQYPSGLLRTADGGKTWEAIGATTSGRWNTGGFLSPQSGLVAGDRGSLAILSQAGLNRSSPTLRGLRGIRALSVPPGERYWLAGEGALLRCSDDQGISWQPPAAPLATELEDFCDFHCLAQRGSRVWVAGSPGSQIWHSADAGASWQPQRTPDSGSIRALRFSSDRHGVAVGDYGRIAYTDDGGETWTTARGGDRRLAALVIQTAQVQSALPFLTRWSREEGYRSAVVVATRRDVDDASAFSQTDVRFQRAVQIAGGNVTTIDWRLPLSIPGLAQNEERLLEQWYQLTDRRLPQVLLGNLVSRIRTDRPSLVLIEEPAPGDFAAGLIQQAVIHAVEQAGDPTRFPEQFQLGGLSPWSVKKLVQRRREGVGGTITQEALELLPRLGTTLDIASAEADEALGQERETLPPRQQYAVVKTTSTADASERTLFGDLGLGPGSPARRQPLPLSDAQIGKLSSQITQRRNVVAIGQKLTAQPGGANLLLGQMQEIIRSLSPEQAARQLADLGAAARQSGDWGLTESIYAELMTRYPDQPAAVEASIWLIKLWSSSEANWQRLRSVNATRINRSITLSGNTLPDSDGKEITTTGVLFDGSSEIRPVSHSTTSSLLPTSGDLQSVLQSGQTGQSAGQQQMLIARWQEMANQTAKRLEGAYPHLKQHAELQFVTAALARRKGDPRRADEIYGRYLSTISDDPWHIAAAGETFLVHPGAISPKPEVVCRRTATPPVLDGLLGDNCWAEAQEVRLTATASRGNYVGPNSTESPTAGDGRQPIVMFAYDDRFFYFGASIPVEPRLPSVTPDLASRTYDADLDRYDRLALQLDLDRDYATFYHFEVDQRGQLREACWEDWTYNPKWYCAVIRDNNDWRVEAAIPLEELLPPERIGQGIWSVGISRIRPGIGIQSWSATPSDPRPATSGLMRFQ